MTQHSYIHTITVVQNLQQQTAIDDQTNDEKNVERRAAGKKRCTYVENAEKDNDKTKYNRQHIFNSSFSLSLLFKNGRTAATFSDNNLNTAAHRFIYVFALVRGLSIVGLSFFASIHLGWKPLEKKLFRRSCFSSLKNMSSALITICTFFFMHMHQSRK